MYYFPLLVEDAPTTSGHALGIAAFALAAALVFLPILVTYITSRRWLNLLASVFCLLSIFVSLSGVYFPFFALIYVPLMGGGLWMTGLLCGLAASIDAMSEQRMKREQRRVITEQRKLGESVTNSERMRGNV